MKYFISFVLILFGFFASAQNLSYNQWLDKSVKFLEINRLDSAAVALQNAMKTEPANPKNASLLFNLGKIQHSLGLKDEAYISLTAALSGNVDEISVLHERALLLCDLARFDEAMDDYNAIIAKSPRNVEAYYRRGLLFFQKNQRKKAESDFAKCEELDAENVLTKLGKALILKLDNKWDDAEKVYSEIIDATPSNNSLYLLYRAECSINLGHFSKAAADLRAAEASEKDTPDLYFLRGIVRLNQFDKLAAKADFEKAKALGYDAETVNKWLLKTK